MMRSMNSLNIGTVNAVSPWLGLQIIPLLINWLRVEASELTRRPVRPLCLRIGEVQVPVETSPERTVFLPA